VLFCNAVIGGSLASSCCVVQLVLSFLGFGCSGLVKALEPFRPVLVALSLTHALYLHTSCKSCHVSRVSRYMSLMILLALVASPFVVDMALRSPALVSDRVGTLRVKVDGMGCHACALSVKLALERVPTVSDCEFESSLGLFTCRNTRGESAHVAIMDSVGALGFVVTDIAEASIHPPEGRYEPG
jgi:copper chaperone CopZ